MERDPERFDRMLEKFKIMWKLVPDWRFGQALWHGLLVGLTDEEKKHIYNVRDEKIEKLLDKVLVQIKKR